ncbi:MAG TPA: phosphate ABC transporter substrate-binding protein PstS [Xanthobacteraceae bacterium]
MRQPSLIVVAVSCWASLSTSALSADVVLGAGSTFVYPVLAKWAAAYEAVTGVRIDYQAVGSGVGIRQIKSRTVDFGASDAPLRPDELAAVGLMQFPVVVGGVVPVVNVDGIGPGQLRLTGSVLADIYLGKITRWNAEAIRELNPGLPLPDQAIIPIYRADASGTTFVLADYLARVSAEWRDEIGVSTAVAFPTGMGGKGNDGVAGSTSRTRGAIGYVEHAYAIRGNLAYVSLQNRDGDFVTPSRHGFQSAVANANWTAAPALAASLSHQLGRQTWPITGATFALIYKQQQKRLTAVEMLKFFDWSFRAGARLAEELQYVPMPKDAVQMIESAWAEVSDAHGQPAWMAPATAKD